MTSPEAHDLTIPLSDGNAVSGLLLMPAAVRAGYVLAHGAGAGMSHPFMSAAAEQLANRGIATLRYQFPYMEHGSRRPDPPKIAHAAVRAAVNEAARRLPDVPLFAGGKSFGGRMTSQAQSQAPLPGITGLVFLGFPLHPAKRPSLDRAQHLASVHVPMLFLQGALRQPRRTPPDRPRCRGARNPSNPDDVPRRRSLVPRPRANRTHGRTGSGQCLRRHRNVDGCELNAPACPRTVTEPHLNRADDAARGGAVRQAVCSPRLRYSPARPCLRGSETVPPMVRLHGCPDQRARRPPGWRRGVANCPGPQKVSDTMSVRDENAVLRSAIGQQFPGSP